MSSFFWTIMFISLMRASAFKRCLPTRKVFTTKYAAKIVGDAEEYQVINIENSEYKDDMLRVGAGVRIELSPSLVLNADYTPLSHLPLSLWSWQDTLRAVFSGKAVVVSEYSDLIVRSVSCSFPLPSVIALKTYQKVPSSSPVMSRRNLYIRDGFKCQVRNNCQCFILYFIHSLLLLDLQSFYRPCLHLIFIFYAPLAVLLNYVSHQRSVSRPRHTQVTRRKADVDKHCHCLPVMQLEKRTNQSARST
jgi:hypothetical protein